jgi:hypothetical protein
MCVPERKLYWILFLLFFALTMTIDHNKSPLTWANGSSRTGLVSIPRVGKDEKICVIYEKSSLSKRIRVRPYVVSQFGTEPAPPKIQLKK